MKCKICNQNETDSTSGICWKCYHKPIIYTLTLNIAGEWILVEPLRSELNFSGGNN